MVDTGGLQQFIWEQSSNQNLVDTGILVLAAYPNILSICVGKPVHMDNLNPFLTSLLVALCNADDHL
jgi:hypothetical protein